jgi:hypothetical protein
MGQTADQLRQEIEQKREDAASKIDQIESRVQELPQMAKDTVTETVILGGLMGGDKGGQRGGGQHSGQYGGQHSGSQQGGMASGIRGAAKSAGLDDALSNASAALMGMLTERVSSIVEESFPQLAERMKAQSGSSRNGSSSGQDGSPRSLGVGTASAAQTDAAGRPASTMYGGGAGESGIHG